MKTASVSRPASLSSSSSEERRPRSSAEFQFRAALQDHVSVDQGSDSKSDHERKKITQKKGSASLCEALQSTLWKRLELQSLKSEMALDPTEKTKKTTSEQRVK